MKVDIYITTTFHGDFKRGNGAYGIILSTMLCGKEKIKQHYAGWDGISRQKLNVRAVTEAIQYINMPCDVVIHTDSPYVQYVIENGNTNGSFIELWTSFFAVRNRMKSVKVEREARHKYRSHLRLKLAEGRHTTINDR